MKLRTEIDITPLSEQIEYSNRIFTIGSCFAQSIGEKLERAKFRTTINPTGTLFNPLSICNTIERLCEHRTINSEELREGDLGWYHYDFHSSLNGATPEETTTKINTAIEQGGAALKAAEWVIITLGTAWIYEITDSRQVVANCHKEPARNFTRRRASLNEIVERLNDTIERYLSDKNIILTLSPIRHIADGLSENNLSKSTLRLAIEEVVTRNPQHRFYLPAYEILIDDLRDYRFYSDDMVHPSDVAVTYIWDKFCEAALSPHTKELLTKVMKIVKAAEHRPTNPNSEAHKTLCRAQLRAIETLQEVEFSNESEYFNASLKINL